MDFKIFVATPEPFFLAELRDKIQGVFIGEGLTSIIPENVLKK
jgi:hypothetical protein